MMGDGVIDIAGLGGMARAAGYGGLWEVEIFSERWWGEDPDGVLARCAAQFEQIDLV